MLIGNFDISSNHTMRNQILFLVYQLVVEVRVKNITTKKTATNIPPLKYSTTP